MKEIKLDTWDAKLLNGETVKESIVTVLSLIVSVSSDDLPKGMEGFRLMRRLAENFDSAEKSGTLKLDNADYATLKALTEKNIPAKLAMNPKIFAEVEKFLAL